MVDEHALVRRRGLIRAETDTPVVEVRPGEHVRLSITVLNASPVIDLVGVRFEGVATEKLTIAPSPLKLFPEESIEVTIDAVFPATLRAGAYEVLVVVESASAEVGSAEVPVTLVVAEQPAITLVAEPPVRTGGRRAEYELAVENVGNAAIRAQLRATDADRALRLELDRPVRQVEPGTTELIELRARGKRPWFGAPVERLITIELVADDTTETANVAFRQRPRLTAGVITLLTLALIGLLWALAMLFGVSAALAPPAPTKEVPASFSTGGIGVEDLDPAVVGGTVTGTVTAASTGQPVARVTVEAFDRAGRLVAATATDDEGVYELGALLPTRYLVRMRAAGFTEQWWPDAPTSDGADLLSVSPTSPLEGIDAQVTGEPAVLGGQALAGDAEQQPVSVEVIALDLLGGPATTTTTSDGDGVWSIGGLTAPATYRVIYRSEGYAPVEVTQPLEAGQQIVVNTVRLPAADGAISGLVVDRDGSPLGGIEIEAQRGDTVITATTPTAGEIGTFQLVDLETPATYLLTFRGEGRASETRAVRLGPGESLEGLEIVLPADTGVVAGRVVDGNGNPVGGVTVTLSGGDTLLTTETFTSGQVGRFRLAGVPVPGVYAVSFERPGSTQQTVQTTLTLDAPTSELSVTLVSSLGELTGIVTDGAGDPAGGIVIEVADGDTTRTTTTASAPEGQRGRFVVGGLEPGTYTITARAPDGSTQTILREVTAGRTTDVAMTVGWTP